MPLYEYQCKDCAEEFEKMVLFSESTKIQECPHCGSQNTRKKISRIALKSISGTSLSSTTTICNSNGGFS